MLKEEGLQVRIPSLMPMFYLFSSFRHILPETLVSSAPEKGSPEYEDWYVKSMSDHCPVILYLHGNAFSRASSHRIELYSVLRKLDYHVVAFDYRGE